MGRIRQEVSQKLFLVQLAREEEVAEMEAKLEQCAKDKEATTKNLQSLGL